MSLFILNILTITVIFIILFVIFNMNLKWALERNEGITNGRVEFVRFEWNLTSKSVLEKMRCPLEFDSLFRTQVECSSAKNVFSLKKFIEKYYPSIMESEFVSIDELNSSLLLTINGESNDTKPALVMFDIDAIVDSRIRLNHTDDLNIDLKDKLLVGFGSVSVVGTVCGTLDAIDEMLQEFHTPKHPFYVYFARDNQLLDRSSQRALLEYFQRHSIRLDFILEAPGVVAKKNDFGLNKDIAMIGVTRKHALISLYQDASETTTLSNIISVDNFILTLTKKSSNHFGDGFEDALLESLIGHSNYWYSLMYSNRWFFDPFLTALFESNLYLRTVIRSRMSVSSHHLLPLFRTRTMLTECIHSRDDVRTVIEKRKKDISRFEISMIPLDVYQSPITRYNANTTAFRRIRNAFLNSFGNNSIAIEADSFDIPKARFLENITDNIYQFSPTIIGRKGLEKFRTHNEQLTLEHYCKLIYFYKSLFY